MTAPKRLVQVACSFSQRLGSEFRPLFWPVAAFGLQLLDTPYSCLGQQHYLPLVGAGSIWQLEAEFSSDVNVSKSAAGLPRSGSLDRLCTRSSCDLIARANR